MKAHLIKTDNANVSHKVQLRKEAIKNIDEIKVLDLFAGNNVLWSNFDCKKYYGVESVKDKGRNINSNNLKIIPSLDLSEFNVIDLDSYGIPANQIELIFQNKTLRSGTIIIYTCIGNAMSSIPKSLIKHFNFENIYKKCKTLINKKSSELFYAYLYENGVRVIREYEEESSNFSKKYGYFVINE